MYASAHLNVHEYKIGWIKYEYPLMVSLWHQHYKNLEGMSRIFLWSFSYKVVMKDKHYNGKVSSKNKIVFHVLRKTYFFYQISIIVIPGLIQLITYFRTCRCASAASRKSFQISSLAWSNAFFSSLVVLQAAVRLYSL